MRESICTNCRSIHSSSIEEQSRRASWAYGKWIDRVLKNERIYYDIRVEIFLFSSEYSILHVNYSLWQRILLQSFELHCKWLRYSEYDIDWLIDYSSLTSSVESLRYHDDSSVREVVVAAYFAAATVLPEQVRREKERERRREESSILDSRSRVQIVVTILY